ncbi:hypothetical protein JAAARDRAFT_56620 [Jaapia argillacea MUCL 33604]|uniref:Glutathione reductase n=1 Tax=Jaapia argillacea MUCL 33604 TaxID=933084 RepID=A0A067QAJ1_9AGAM|nr:hypothetical protein JAAARDRAFT_56620 [Jaapia argillacea MUCL 33604]
MPSGDKLSYEKYDYVCIGGGSGGIASARRAAQYGKKVALIEATARLGGTCVNIGCVPKKLMWHAADIAETIRSASCYQFKGLGTEPPQFSWSDFVIQRNSYVRKLNDIYASNLAKDGVTHHAGRARLLSPTLISITPLNGCPEYTIEASQICIATGARPRILDDNHVPGASLGIDSDRFFELTCQPKRVAIVGAGYIAVELSGIFRSLGTEVHVIVRKGDTFLGMFADPLIQDTVHSWMERSGVKVHMNSSVLRAQRVGANVQTSPIEVYTDQGEMLEVDVLLWAIGRLPNTENLGLESVGIMLDDARNIVVDDYQNTSVKGISAIGDVTGKAMLTPVAIQAGRRLANRLFGGIAFQDDHLDYANIPTVVFSHPPIGAIGLTEPQAREKYGDAVKTYTSTFTALYFSMMDPAHKEPSVYKLIVVGPQERVVGIHIFGLGSDEVLQGFGVALKMGVCKRDLDETIAIHPSSGEELVTLR